jgi:hypothetical protein
MIDRRMVGGRKVVVLAHCMLNQNTKPDRRARFPGAVQPVLEVLAEEGLAIFQLPCPEIGFAGPWRFSQVIQLWRPSSDLDSGPFSEVRRAKEVGTGAGIAEQRSNAGNRLCHEKGEVDV